MLNHPSDLFKKKILIVAGTGGVGKTTLSAALAFGAARSGKKVIVLTIDPSQRLKTTLGLNTTNSDAQRVQDFENGGVLWASLLKPQDVFDDFVRLLTREKPGAEKILNNKLYQQLSTTLSGSQEFTALEKLYRFATSHEYDLVVVDTPPAQHLRDFLHAPQKLGALFDEQIMKWFRPQSTRGRFLQILSVGTKKVLSVLERLTGAEFIAQLGDFFEHVSDWGDLFKKRMRDYESLLKKSETTDFVLVTGPDPSKWDEILPFFESLKKNQYSCSAVFVNQAQPSWLALPTSESEGPETQAFFELAENHFRARERYLHRNFTSLAKVLSLWLVPELKEDVYDLEGVARLEKVLGGLEPGTHSDERL